MYQGRTMIRYSMTPGHQMVRRRRDHSRRRPAKRRMMERARKGATGPLARVAAAPKKQRSKSQNFLPVSYQAYQPSMPMQKGAASCMSVEAPRAKLTMAMQETVMRAASRWPPGRNRRMWRKTRTTRASVAEEEGRRAVQSETPNSLKKLMARQ